MSTKGSIIVLAYPDTFVSLTGEWQVKLLNKLGIGKHGKVKAGHAAQVLINNETGEARYFDFGRYITPYGKGRVRSAETDVELLLPIRAQIKDGKIENLKEFLVWLSNNPQKTHGEGRLIASVCENIDFNKADTFINDIHRKGSIAYGAFVKRGSNCARFVTDTILASCSRFKTQFFLRKNKLFTPSGIGNVEHASSSGEMYLAIDGEVQAYEGTALKENLRNYLDKRLPREIASTEYFLHHKAQRLDGIGSSAHYELEFINGDYIISQYTECGDLNFRSVFEPHKEGFDINKKYWFVYDSHNKHCHIKQGDEIYCFDVKRGV